jgi:hypothetical protein
MQSIASLLQSVIRILRILQRLVNTIRDQPRRKNVEALRVFFGDKNVWRVDRLDARRVGLRADPAEGGAGDRGLDAVCASFRYEKRGTTAAFR